MPLPDSVLFACNFNSVRSPMAMALLREAMGKEIYVESAGVRVGQVSGFMIFVMGELGLDLTRHASQTFDDLGDSSFDLVISLSPEAHQIAVERTRATDCVHEFWTVSDPTSVRGSRDMRLDAFRQTRDELLYKIRARFLPS